jgi:hypothetical protein
MKNFTQHFHLLYNLRGLITSNQTTVSIERDNKQISGQKVKMSIFLNASVYENPIALERY